MSHKSTILSSSSPGRDPAATAPAPKSTHRAAMESEQRHHDGGHPQGILQLRRPPLARQDLRHAQRRRVSKGGHGGGERSMPASPPSSQLAPLGSSARPLPVTSMERTVCTLDYQRHCEGPGHRGHQPHPARPHRQAAQRGPAGSRVVRSLLRLPMATWRFPIGSREPDGLRV